MTKQVKPKKSESPYISYSMTKQVKITKEEHEKMQKLMQDVFYYLMNGYNCGVFPELESYVSKEDLESLNEYYRC